MLWEEVRDAYPDKWVVVEAIEAHSNNNYRIIDEIAVVDSFEDSVEAFRRNSELHKQIPNRELYFFILQGKILIYTRKSGQGLEK